MEGEADFGFFLVYIYFSIKCFEWLVERRKIWVFFIDVSLEYGIILKRDNGYIIGIVRNDFKEWGGKIFLVDRIENNIFSYLFYVK